MNTGRAATEIRIRDKLDQRIQALYIVDGLFPTISAISTRLMWNRWNTMTPIVAIFGVKENGVIIITTKGKMGQNYVNLNSSA